MRLQVDSIITSVTWLPLQHLVEQLGDLVDPDGGAFQQLHRGAAVRQADHQHAHVTHHHPCPFDASSVGRHGHVTATVQAGEVPARDVEGQDLQLHGKVHLAHLHLLGYLEDDRGEVQDAGDTRSDQQVAGALRGGAGRGDHADRHVALAARSAGCRRTWSTTMPLILMPTRSGSTSNSAVDREAAAAEPAVAGQRVAEVADPDQRDGLAVGEAERATPGAAAAGRPRSRPRGCRASRCRTGPCAAWPS